HNLNGQNGLDNTIWSGLYEISFYQAPYTGATFVNDYIVPAFLTPHGGATNGGYGQGGLTQIPQGQSRPFPPSTNAFWSALDDADYQMVGGCTPGGGIPQGNLYGMTSWLTCGANATVTFSFNSIGIIDASLGPWVAGIDAIGDYGNGWTF